MNNPSCIFSGVLTYETALKQYMRCASCGALLFSTFKSWVDSPRPFRHAGPGSRPGRRIGHL